MKNTDMYFPNFDGINAELYYKSVLIEKYNKQKYSVSIRCCTINDVAVFCVGHARKSHSYPPFDFLNSSISIGLNGAGRLYVLSEYEYESITKDSFVIQKIIRLIEKGKATYETL
jgi:hypothetical protein